MPASPLGQLDPWEQQRMLRALRVVSRRSGVPPEEVLGRGRGHRETVARHQAMFALKHFAGLSFGMLARLFGRDKSTVITAVRELEHRRRVDPVLLDDLNALKAELQS